MTSTETTRPHRHYARAIAIASWDWNALIAGIAVLSVVSASSLPATVTIVFTGFKGSGDSRYEVVPTTLALILVGVAVVFAVVVLVVWLFAAAMPIGVSIALSILDVLLMIFASQVATSILWQLGRTVPMGTSFAATSGLSWLQIPVAYTVFAAVFVGTFFVTRRLTLGTWRRAR